MVAKPSQYISWTDGAPTKVIQPPSAQSLAGFVPGEPVVAQYFNWVLWTLDGWIQYLDQVQNTSSAAGSGAIGNARIIGGGFWSFNLATSTLAWTSAFSLTMPGADDTDNQIAAGSVVLNTGDVAYLQANVPFSTTGTTVSGSNQITNLNYNLGIAVGQYINGAGIPSGATVAAFSGSTATISANATASATAAPLTFTGATPPSVLTASERALFPSSNTVILARRSGAIITLGVNAGEMILRDGESKLLRSTGYSVVYSGVAGEALTAGQAVYASPGASDGRTLGALYKCDTSVANGAIRGQALGIVMTAASGGAAVQAIQIGMINGFSGLTPGAAIYVDPATPGGLVSGRPSIAGTFAAPVGIASSDTQLIANAGPGQMVTGAASQGNYAVFNEGQLSAAITSASSGGGVIVLEGPFSIAAPHTLPAGTLLLGQLGQSILTIATGGAMTLADGAKMQDVSIVSPLTSGKLVSLGSFTTVEHCKFSPNTAGTAVCLAINGSGNRVNNNTFAGCAGGTPTGIRYVSGAGNIDESSIFI
jgi:hypothetical protein